MTRGIDPDTAFEQGRLYCRLVGIGIDIKMGTQVFDGVFSGYDPERLFRVVFYFEISFTSDGDLTLVPGEGRGIRDAGCRVEPNHGAIGEGQFILTAA